MSRPCVAAVAILISIAAYADRLWSGDWRYAISADERTRIDIRCDGTTSLLGSWKGQVLRRDDAGIWAPLWSVSVTAVRSGDDGPMRVEVLGPNQQRLRESLQSDAIAAGDPARATHPYYVHDIAASTRTELFSDRLLIEITWGERFCFSIPSGAGMEPARADGPIGTALADLRAAPNEFAGQRVCVYAQLQHREKENDWVAIATETTLPVRFTGEAAPPGHGDEALPGRTGGASGMTNAGKLSADETVYLLTGTLAVDPLHLDIAFLRPDSEKVK